MNRQELAPVGDASEWAARPHLFAPIQREMDRLFEDFERGLGRLNLVDLAPRMDLAETPGQIEIGLDLPGVDLEDIDIAVEDGVLTVSGQRRTDCHHRDKAYQVAERSYGAFARSVRLPAGVDLEQVSADLAKGVLTILVPKPAAAQSTHIPIMSIR